MDEQTEMAFGYALGGLAEDVDPVSGNEVPVGSMPEEVRDDIPAQLSEGEYVVPADVVRFFGVKFFEDIRTEAKQGFAQMEANGRVGGEPVSGMEMGGDELPFDISELQMIDDGEPEQPMMNKGGYMRGYAAGGGVPGLYEAPAMEYRAYTNAEGNEITIMYFNGMPMSIVPEGYTAVAPEPTTSAAAPVTNANYGEAGTMLPVKEDSGQNTVKVFENMAKDQEGQPEAVNYKELSASELATMVDERKSLTGDAITGVVGVVNPFLGIAIKAAMWHNARQVEKELARRVKDTGISATERNQYSKMLEIAQADKQGLLSKIRGINENESAVDLIQDQKDKDVQDALYEAVSYDPDVTSGTVVTVEELNEDYEPGTALTPDVSDIVTTPIDEVTGARNETYIAPLPSSLPFSMPPEDIVDTTIVRKPKVDKPTIPEVTISPAARAEVAAQTVRSRKSSADKALANFDRNVNKVVDNAARGLATREEVKQIKKEAAKIKSSLKDQSRGIKRGFKDGGLVSKPKK